MYRSIDNNSTLHYGAMPRGESGNGRGSSLKDPTRLKLEQSMLASSQIQQRLKNQIDNQVRAFKYDQSILRSNESDEDFHHNRMMGEPSAL